MKEYFSLPQMTGITHQYIIITVYLVKLINNYGNVRADFDFRALESEDDRFLNQLLGFFSFADFGVVGDSDKSGDLAASEGVEFGAFRGLGSLDFFLDFFDFDFPVKFAPSSISPEITSLFPSFKTSLCSGEGDFLIPAVYIMENTAKCVSYHVCLNLM